MSSEARGGAGVQRRYVAVEMSVAATISGLLSLLFALIVFRGGGQVPALGSPGLKQDSLPQTALVVLMSVLAPTLITHRRMRSGAIMPSFGRQRRPRHPLVRSILIALVATIVAGSAHALLLPLGPASWPFASVVVYKIGYGVLLGAVSARWAVRAALADDLSVVPVDSDAATVRRDA